MDDYSSPASVVQPPAAPPLSPMAAPVPNAELMHSLGRLVRGLSALFWGLPVALVVCFHTANAESLRSFGIVPPMAATGLLCYGLWQLGAFQRQERVWRNALDRATILSLVNFGLSPFLFWANRVPGGFLGGMVLLMIASSLFFLGSLNGVLRRLGAMLPDESLRSEIRQFTMLNFFLVGLTFSLAAAYFTLDTLDRNQSLPPNLSLVMELLHRVGFWFLILIMLVPLAMTMALLWKTKEVILDSVFSAKLPAA
jgi:hypothetical protein